MNYSNLQLVRSDAFEKLVYAECGQIGSFAIISTNYPQTTEKRLNEGWIYPPGDPRQGSQSPPLAYCTDWKILHGWQVANLDRSITELPDFRQRFARPCVIHTIERRLMKDDNAVFPELRAKGMTKNGLNLVECLPHRTSLLRNADCAFFSDHQDLVTEFLIAQAQELIELLELQ